MIPRLEIKGPNLVKGIHLEGLRVLGDPEAFANHYDLAGADELLYMDVVASLYGRDTLLEMVRRTAQHSFIPLCVGGGLRTMTDIREVLRAGADKVAINSAALARPEFIREASTAYGSSTIVVSIEAMRRPDGSYQAFTDSGRERSGRDVLEWAVEVERLGAGEILMMSIDREGTGKGFDLDLLAQVRERVDIPLIAAGGAGSVEHVLQAVQRADVDAVALSSILHYGIARDLAVEAPGREGNRDFLAAGKPQPGIKPVKLRDLKTALNLAGHVGRPLPEDAV